MNARSDPVPELATAAEARELCTRLTRLVGDLSALLERETGLIRQQRLDEVASLEADKSALFAGFARDLAALRANAVLVGSRAPNDLEALRRALEALAPVVERNMAALEAARAVSHGLVEAIFTFAAEHDGGPSCYGSNARMAARRPARPTALAVNTTL